MKASDLLMKYEDYSKLEHETPYTFALEKDNQFIYYFGEHHTFDPDDEQFRKNETYWNEFISKTNGENCIALVEGGKRPLYKTRDESILKQGGAGFLTWLATQENIETFSPEPPAKYVFSELEKHFAKEEIEYYFFARMCYQWNNLVEKPPFEVYVGNSLKYDKSESGWNNFDFSIENMKKITKDMFAIEFDENARDFFYKIINPTTTFSKINEVSRFEDEGFRDTYIVDQIERLWKEGKNIFIVYGASHAVVQEKALKHIVGN